MAEASGVEGHFGDSASMRLQRAVNVKRASKKGDVEGDA